MKRRGFTFWHSFLGVVLLVLAEAVVRLFLDSDSYGALVIALSLLGGMGIIYVATEAIEEVKSTRYMFAMLSVVILEFIVLFACQYGLLSLAIPDSFSGISVDPVSLLLHSTMIFALNPLYLPTNALARLLVLINTLESLVLAFFVLQNIWQFRNRSL